MGWPQCDKAPVNSSVDKFTRTCADCQQLITLQLEARALLSREIARSPDSPAVGVLRDKVWKLQAATETQFMKAMDALNAKTL